VEQNQTEEKDTLIKLSRQFVTLLVSGDFEDAVKNFDTTMTKLSPPKPSLSPCLFVPIFDSINSPTKSRFFMLFFFRTLSVEVEFKLPSHD